MKKTNKVNQLAVAVMLGLGIAVAGVAQPNAADAAKAPLTLKVSSMSIEGVEGAKADEIKHLIPEINKENVNVKKLSKQISLVNDNKVFNITTEFKPQAQGEYKLLVKVEKVKTDNFALTVSNTGNQYTGNWRTGLSYAKSDLTGMGDTLGLSYVTSPHHMDEVHQAGFSYKFMFPRLSDTAYISYGYSDVDMGNIYSVSTFDINATGESKTLSFHYQHNFKYSKAKKQILDFGIDHKKYTGTQEVRLNGVRQPAFDSNYDIQATVASLSYIDISRWNNQALAYTAGYYQNLNGNKAEYNAYRRGSDDNFKYFRLGANYQYRTKSDWLFGLRATGQYTNDDLITTEQLGAGGATSIRGFKERIASGDKGVIGSFEIYTPQMKCLPNQRFVFFLDAGALANNHYNTGEKSRNLASVGIGYRFYEKDGLSVNLDYAKTISDDTIDMSKYDRPWSLNICYRF